MITSRRAILTPALSLMAVVLTPPVISAVGWRPRYLFQLASLAAILLVAALSQTLIAGFAGQMSFGQAGFMAVGGYATALLTTRVHATWWMGIAAGVGLAAVVAAVVGIIVLRLRGPYFVMATLAFGGIVLTIAVNWLPVTGGPSGVSGIPPPSFGGFTIDEPVNTFYFYWAAAVLIAFGVAWLRRTWLGTGLVAIREDELATAAAGVRVVALKNLAFLLSAAIAGFSGALMAHFVGYVSPDSFSVTVSILIVTQVMVGGIDRVAGAAFGVIFLLVVNELLLGHTDLQLLVYGLLMLAIVLFLPRGIVNELPARAASLAAVMSRRRR